MRRMVVRVQKVLQIAKQNETGGTNRFWELEVENWQRITIPAIELEFLDASPHNPK